MRNKSKDKGSPGSLIPEKSLRHFSGEPRTWHQKVFIKTFGWPYVQVRRDDFGAVEEDK